MSPSVHCFLEEEGPDESEGGEEEETMEKREERRGKEQRVIHPSIHSSAAAAAAAASFAHRTERETRSVTATPLDKGHVARSCVVLGEGFRSAFIVITIEGN